MGSDVRERGGRVKEQTRDQREPRVRRKVVTEHIRGLTRAQPAHGDRQHAEQSRRTAAQQHSGQHQAQSAARHPQPRGRRFHIGEVAGDREHGDHNHRPQGPAIRTRGQRRDGTRGRKRQHLRYGDRSARRAFFAHGQHRCVLGVHSRIFIGQTPCS